VNEGRGEVTKPLALLVAGDFLVRGTAEPIALLERGREAIALAIALASSIGDLDRNLEALLDLTYVLDGKADSPEAARALREAISASPDARTALGLKGSREDLRALKTLAKKRVQKLESGIQPSIPRQSILR
jgi:hypothetical protein